MDLKAMREFLALQRQAETQGKSVSQVLEEEIEKEIKRQGDSEAATVSVQIMPHNVVGGYGKFPAVVMMPRDKAVELAKLGTVKIILSEKEDLVSDEDQIAIQEHVDEMMSIRKSREKRPKQEPYVKTAQLTNVVPFERMEEIEKKAKGAEDESTIVVSKSELTGTLAPESRRAAKA